MESEHGAKKIIWIFLFLLVGCSPQQNENTEDIPAVREEFLLKDGDIICRLGAGFFSNMFKEYASKEKRYSHVGIIEVSGDSAFVIHVEASELTGIGFTKREPIAVFLDGIHTWGIYRTNLSDSINHRIKEKAKVYFDRNTPFDLDFNSNDDNEVYCTELVALAINQVSDSITITPSIAVEEKRIYSLDDIYQARGIRKIYSEERVNITN